MPRFSSILDSSAGESDSKMDLSVEEMDSLPPKLRENAGLLSPADKELVSSLVRLGQHHLFAYWDTPGTNDDKKASLIAQLRGLDVACGPSGITGYLNRARRLLGAAKAGENPLSGWRASVPEHGVRLFPFTEAFSRYEALGKEEIGSCAFVLVAGGLGERLGFSGIKVALPVETLSAERERRSYLQHYCEQILSIQERFAPTGHRVPLAIMVSDDTESKTVALLREHAFFGLSEEQVTILKQEKVPALMSNAAHIALSSPYIVDAKPHGHGDVHSLLFRSGTCARWQAQGVRWLCCFQDTNALALQALPAMLGVSRSLSLDMNSAAVPRVAQQAVGAIAKLVHDDGREMTINVEYNQLDPLLRSTGEGGGDANDPATGLSPFPGNINTLLLRMDAYLATLARTEGEMPEFVNPKYKDAQRMEFKKATRLECMMQDLPKLFPATASVTASGTAMSGNAVSGNAISGTEKEGPANTNTNANDNANGVRVGFTMLPAWFCYSPCKNNAKDAALSLAQGVPASAAFTAESDQLLFVPRLLCVLRERERLTSSPSHTHAHTDSLTEKEMEERLSAALTDCLAQEQKEEFLGIPASVGPRVIVSPRTALFASDVERVFPSPSEVSLSTHSTLSLRGPVTVRALTLDGSLSVDATDNGDREREKQREIVVSVCPQNSIVNEGHALAAVDSEDMTIDETLRMRGYRWTEHACKSVSFADIDTVSVSLMQREGEREETKDVSTSSSAADAPPVSVSLSAARSNVFVFNGRFLVPQETLDAEQQRSLAQAVTDSGDKDKEKSESESTAEGAREGAQQQVVGSGGSVAGLLDWCRTAGCW